MRIVKISPVFKEADFLPRRLPIWQGRTMTSPYAETSTKEGFESELYLIEVFVFYV